MPAWRKASDPPEETGRYLCIIEYGRRSPKYKMGPVRYDAEIKNWRPMYIADEVTHWAPLPEAPEGVVLYEEEKMQ